MLHAVSAPCHAAQPVVTSSFYTPSKVAENPWKLAYPLRGFWIHKHREITGQVLPAQYLIIVCVYPTTTHQARRHQAVGFQWGPSKGFALEAKLCIPFLFSSVCPVYSCSHYLYECSIPWISECGCGRGLTCPVAHRTGAEMYPQDRSQIILILWSCQKPQ